MAYTPPPLDKTVFYKTTLDEADADDIEYWLAQPPADRIACLESLRRWIYGDEEIDARIPRVLEITQRDPD